MRRSQSAQPFGLRRQPAVSVVAPPRRAPGSTPSSSLLESGGLAHATRFARTPGSGSESLYTERHARSGVAAKLPSLECWPNQYPGYEIVIEISEFTSVCPRTGLPDFGLVRIRYMPRKWCVELKSLKYYINGFRNLGIFQENAVNRILEDVVAAAKPAWAVVTGEFNARGGMKTTVEARYPRVK